MKNRFLPLLLALLFVSLNLPGYTAPPATPATPAAPASPTAVAYYGSEKSAIFHLATCAALDRVKDANIVKYSSRAEAIKAGKMPCLKCKP